ncbi:Paired domain-containing protein [Caenorhabditis elegans]|uniref:Paired domain-containing protein n=1 Tax=Caenorhabditis elegans TaxID=6239 RepID=Q19677_CAEEL|nr:Paired domain-containing protein [Caenorhabditis elegans]CCD69796.1 Paired domain-containing protein [Caenorhabditis elegans]|eukprot:NP_495533.2 N-terminal PAX (PAI domain only) protein [Caenorhabditis elegans]
MLPQIHQHTHFPVSTNGSTGSPPNNTLPPPIIPYSLLSAFYSLSSANISTSPEINEGEKVKAVGRSYNPGRPLCLEDRKKIVRLYEEGCRVSHIARLIGVTHSCVSKIMSRYRRTGSVQPRSFRATENQENDNATWQQQQLKQQQKKEKPLPFSIERILSPDIKKEIGTYPRVISQ